MRPAHPEERKRRFLLAALLLLSYLATTASAQLNITSTDTVQLWVTVAEKTMVDIQPTRLAWQNVDPGTETLITQAVGFPAEVVQIENIGSTNISYIWFNNTYPSSQPFGSGLASSYDAGNFAVIRRNATGERYFFSNAVEYNESQIIYLQFPTIGRWAHGRFRNASSEYFWAINSSTGNCSNRQFRIGKTAHSQTQLGTIDLRTCDPALSGAAARGANDCRAGTLTRTNLAPYTGSDMWGYADVYIGPNTAYENYTVAVHWNCSTVVKVMFIHWNMDAPGSQEGAAHPDYFYTTVLKPGEHIIANVKLRIPYGAAAGNITGSLLVTVQAIDVAG